MVEKVFITWEHPRFAEAVAAQMKADPPCPMCGLSPCETRVECAMEAKKDEEN